MEIFDLSEKLDIAFHGVQLLRDVVMLSDISFIVPKNSPAFGCQYRA